MQNLARYVQPRTKSNGKVAYYFCPPRDVLRAGVVAPEPLGENGERARLRALHLNKKIDEWREAKETKASPKVIVSGTIDELFAAYLKSRYYLMDLQPQTQVEYKRYINMASDMVVEKRRFGSLRLSDVRHRHGDAIYDIVVSDKGIVAGFRLVTVLRRVFNIGIKWDMVTANPFAKIEMRMPKGRETRWTPDEVDAYCDAAVDAGRLSMARIMRLAYDTAQRRVDLIWLRKKDFDPDTGILTVTQRKTGTTVYLPLAELYHPWFTELPSPDSFVFLNENTGAHYSKKTFSVNFRRLCREAGLPDHLQFRDIRRTVATELGDSGASEDELMAITGIKSRAVLGIYTKKTLTQARNAVEKLRKQRMERV
jgi:integrase